MSRRSRYARSGQGGPPRAARPDPFRPDATHPGAAPASWAPPSIAGPGVPLVESASGDTRLPLRPAAAVVDADPTLRDETEPLTVAPSRNGNGGHVSGNGHAGIEATNGTGQTGHPNAGGAGCTAPQLRRFIKSRTYVPMHELRRRFAINGGEDDVTLVQADGHQIFVGLPFREGRLVEELLRGGDIGYELSLDPLTPVVIGVYPMRPVPRG
ncbi:MAG TPA: hypothetical protein VKA85_04130 [Candidatus Limnocylindrales bacterium]|nr:hypothetical protein [Candidatus Limnocylindrales bacterium]